MNLECTLKTRTGRSLLPRNRWSSLLPCWSAGWCASAGWWSSRAGVVPNPFFDAVGLVAGALRLPVWQFLIASFAGKGLRFWLLAVLGAAALPA